MSKEKIKNLFIGTSYKNENIFIDTIDIKYNINKEFLSNFISEKENMNIRPFVLIVKKI